jgi:hypothetical protein
MGAAKTTTIAGVGPARLRVLGGAGFADIPVIGSPAIALIWTCCRNSGKMRPVPQQASAS